VTVLVTGGAGYIGSHVVRLLVKRGVDVVIVDDMSNGIATRVGDVPIEQFDVSAPNGKDLFIDVIERYGVDGIIHFAAKKQVGESMDLPLWYYRNNLTGMSNLLEAIDATGVQKLVFSSSAGVYGQPDRILIEEDIVKEPINPYGKSKLVGEWMIDDYVAVSDLRAIKLRYFNVAGAGWDDMGDSAMMNLVPIILGRLAQGKTPMIFGDDYPTEDGTCVRDYVHVADLADAHIAALDALADGTPEHTVFNVGSGQGASVREVIDALGTALGRPLNPEVGERRRGDPARLVADPTRIAIELGWKAEYGLADIAKSAVAAAVWRAAQD
jgi:UDP-glucose 4-epimerase